jgi:hypothetical protein
VTYFVELYPHLPAGSKGNRKILVMHTEPPVRKRDRINCRRRRHLEKEIMNREPKGKNPRSLFLRKKEGHRSFKICTREMSTSTVSGERNHENYIQAQEIRLENRRIGPYSPYGNLKTLSKEAQKVSD